MQNQATANNNNGNNNNRRRINNNNNNGGQQQNRHNNNNNKNNRPRRFTSSNQGRSNDDNANVSRTRRNATMSLEKYNTLARSALSAGDRVLAENYFQHADHYHRVLLSLPPEENRQQNNRENRPQNQADQQNPSEENLQNEAAKEENSFAGEENAMPDLNMLPAFITQPLHIELPQESVE